ncbi:PTS sugar transporter subunit IIB [Aquibacillus saliphilus]|uniref:PTS sugar transporter subunit IIB n=1 Tax=Aquibacillus saliphilus TaxID=1909422 RepID=UPI001CEFC25F|nr:PTS sugar transporter subunit IIB [Aquibacillus saliphilus]
MKILAICGSGLGSSFMVEMNINDILKAENIENIEVEHSDLSSATPGIADLYVVAKDLEDSCTNLGDMIVLNNIVDTDELKTKLLSYLKEKDIS